MLLTVAAGLTAAAYFLQYRPDQQTNADAENGAIIAATDGTVALLSYSPETLDRDFRTAESHLTGDFLSEYDQYTQKIIAPAAKQKSVTTTASIAQAAVSDLHPTSAVVLVFVNLTTTSSELPAPSVAASSVRVSLTKVDGSWLISSFDPV